jgi:hypothetical protein
VCVYGCEGAVGFATMALEGAVLFLLAVGFWSGVDIVLLKVFIVFLQARGCFFLEAFG